MTVFQFTSAEDLALHFYSDKVSRCFHHGCFINFQIHKSAYVKIRIPKAGYLTSFCSFVPLQQYKTGCVPLIAPQRTLCTQLLCQPHLAFKCLLVFGIQLGNIGVTKDILILQQYLTVGMAFGGCLQIEQAGQTAPAGETAPSLLYTFLRVQTSTAQSQAQGTAKLPNPQLTPPPQALVQPQLSQSTESGVKHEWVNS